MLTITPLGLMGWFVSMAESHYPTRAKRLSALMIRRWPNPWRSGVQPLPAFNRYRPARRLAEKAAEVKVPKDVVGRFEKIYRTVYEGLVWSGTQ